MEKKKGTERCTAIERDLNGRSQENENHVNNENLGSPDMTGHVTETRIGTEGSETGGSETGGERGKERERGSMEELVSEKNQRKVTEGVEAGSGPLIDERTENPDILRTVPLRWVAQDQQDVETTYNCTSSVCAHKNITRYLNVSVEKHSYSRAVTDKLLRATVQSYLKSTLWPCGL